MKYGFLLMFMAVACASTTASSPGSKSEDSSEGSEVDPNAGRSLPPSEGPEQTCVDSENEPVKCESDKDCCQGFYCGLDPEGSTRIKTCVYGGGGGQ